MTMQLRHYDALVVGARVAGAATGLLLARAGARVLIIDRDPEVGDTLSTHALTRPAVELLNAWGLLGPLLAAGTPVVRRARFRYGAEEITVPIRSSDAVPGLCAPRRWLLDRTVLDAATAAGADLALGTELEACLSDGGGRVTGAVLSRRDGSAFECRADLLIGADGRSSTVAALVGAETLVASPHRAATIFGYFPGIANDGYRWWFGHRSAGGAIPTNDGMHCVFASCPAGDFKARFAADPAGGLRETAGTFDPDVAAHLRAAPLERLRRFLGAPGHIRARTGRGWALVGDAACFKDPATAHGITDALLDAHHLSTALGQDGGPERYGRARQPHVAALFEATQAIAGFDWDFQSLATLHAMVNDCLKREQASLGTSAGGVGSEPPVASGTIRTVEPQLRLYGVDHRRAGVDRGLEAFDERHLSRHPAQSDSSVT